MALLVPPISVRGMTRLNRDAFKTVIEVPCLVFNDRNVGDMLPNFKKYLLKMKKFKPVERIENNVVVYMDPKYEKLISNENLERRKIELTYENWRPEEIMRAILPEDIEIPTSFSQIGHILHLNLRDCHLPYKHVIADIYLDHIANVRTIVNKVNTIDTEFRFFKMEILAGDKNTIARVKENDCTFEFDFAHVYWNPRLSTEHTRILNLLKKEDILYDVFAGIGPFAIPAARKGLKVFANDLNPKSYEWLVKNASSNKVESKLSSWNLDGREFLITHVKNDILKRRDNNAVGLEHITMNLPGLAVEFLDVFSTSFSKEEINKISLNPPMIHLYCFVKYIKSDDVRGLAISLVEKHIGYKLENDCLIDVKNVRNVSPNKQMMRVSFLLKNLSEEPVRKKSKYHDVLGTNGEKQEERV